MGLTRRVATRLERDFKPSELDEAAYVMEAVLASDPTRTDESMERLHAAMLRTARGDLERLLESAALAELDWRDLLVEAGLAGEDWRDRLTEDLGLPDDATGTARETGSGGSSERTS